MSSQVLLTSFCGFPQQKTNQRKTSQKSRGPRALRSNWNWVATDLWSVPFGCLRRIPIKMFDWKWPNKTTNQWLVGDWFVCSEKKHGVLFGEMMITNHELHRIWQESSKFFYIFFWELHLAAMRNLIQPWHLGRKISLRATEIRWLAALSRGTTRSLMCRWDLHFQFLGNSQIETVVFATWEVPKIFWATSKKTGIFASTEWQSTYTSLFFHLTCDSPLRMTRMLQTVWRGGAEQKIRPSTFPGSSWSRGCWRLVVDPPTFRGCKVYLKGLNWSNLWWKCNVKVTF